MSNFLMLLMTQKKLLKPAAASVSCELIQRYSCRAIKWIAPSTEI